MFQGYIKKSGNFWLIEVPLLDVMTQGRTRREAYEMIVDAIESLINTRGFHVKIVPQDRNEFLVASKTPNPLYALMLKRQRAKHNLSLNDMKKKLGEKSRSSYAQYERGRSVPSINKIEKILRAMGVRGIKIDLFSDKETTGSIHVKDL